jgi:hypothetical protein
VGGVAAQRASLTLVPSWAGEAAERTSFCSHCGACVPPERASARVCGSCGLGLILEASSDLAPDRGGAFLVLDDSLSVCAVSRSAEAILRTTETSAVNRHLTTFLCPADAETQADRDLAGAVIRAAHGAAGSRRLTVRPANTYGVRIAATIGPCGPQPAALIVLE